MRLSEELELWRAERPDEWKMAEFIRAAKSLEEIIDLHARSLPDMDSTEWNLGSYGTMHLSNDNYSVLVQAVHNATIEAIENELDVSDQSKCTLLSIANVLDKHDVSFNRLEFLRACGVE